MRFGVAQRPPSTTHPCVSVSSLHTPDRRVFMQQTSSLGHPAVDRHHCSELVRGALDAGGRTDVVGLGATFCGCLGGGFVPVDAWFVGLAVALGDVGSADATGGVSTLGVELEPPPPQQQPTPVSENRNIAMKDPTEGIPQRLGISSLALINASRLLWTLIPAQDSPTALPNR